MDPVKLGRWHELSLKDYQKDNDHIDFVSLDELGAEISWIEGGQGTQTGGPPWDTPKGHIPELDESASHYMLLSRHTKDP